MWMNKRRLSYFVLILTLILASCEMIKPLDNKLLKDPDNVSKEPETDPEAVTPWGAPEDLTALSGMADRIDLQWKPVQGASYYLISYTQDPFGDFSTPLDEVTQSADMTKPVTWRLTGTEANVLKPGSVYYFRIRAVKSGGETSPFSPVATGGLMDIPRIAEPSLQPGNVTLRWSLPNLGIDGVSYTPVFTVFRKKGEEDFAAVSTPEGITADSGAYSFVQKGIDPKTAYTYKIQVAVEGSDQSLESSAYEVVTMDQSYPNPVTDFTATPGSLAESVSLSWTVPAELAGYEGIPVVYTLSRQIGGETSEVLKEKTADLTSYSDTTALVNREYTYTVTPFYVHDQDGAPVYSTPGEAVTASGYRLWEPAELSVKADGGAALAAWTYPADKAPGVTFRIFREEDLIDGTSEKIAEGLTEPSFRDETLSPLTSYHYRVAAVRSGETEQVSAWLRTSEPFRFTPGADDTVRELTVTEGLSDRITLEWAGMEGVTYNIFRNETGYGYTGADLIAGDLTVSESGRVVYPDEGLDPGAVRFYRIESTMDGQKFMTDSIRGYTLALPGGLTASQGLYTDKIALSWNETEGATAYRLKYRKKDSGEDYTSGSEFTPADLKNPSLEFSPPGNGDAAVRGLQWDLALTAIKKTDGQPDVETVAGAAVTGCTLGPALSNLQPTAAEYNDKVVLTWDAVTGADRYDIYRNTEDNPLTARRVLQGVRGTTAEDLDTAYLTEGRTSWYFIRPLKQGITSNILSAGRTGYALSPPAGTAATQGTSATDINLTWSAAPGASSYNVYRKTGSSWLKVGSGINGLAYNYPMSDQDLNDGNVRSSFRIRSVSAGGLESLDPAEDTEGYALSRPIAVSATKGDVSLKDGERYYTRVFWPAVEGAESYLVQRKDDRSGSWHDAATVNAGSGDVVEFRDFDALILHSYEQEYRVLTKRGGVTTGWSDVTSGYRQVSPKEFLNMVNYTLKRSMAKFFYTSGSAGGGLISESRSGDAAGTYTHGIDRNGFFGSNYRRYYKYSGYRDYFLTLDGSFMKNNGGGVSGNSREGDYRHEASDTTVLTISGPSGTSLYSGTVRFESVSIDNNDGNSPNWDGGHFTVVYDGKTVNFDRNSGVPIPYFMDDSVLISKLGY